MHTNDLSVLDRVVPVAWTGILRGDGQWRKLIFFLDEDLNVETANH